jgi:hypothetical protein
MSVPHEHVRARLIIRFPSAGVKQASPRLKRPEGGERRSFALYKEERRVCKIRATLTFPGGIC